MTQTVGYIIAWLIVGFVFWDAISTIRWLRRQSELDKTLLMSTIAISIVLLLVERALYTFSR